MKQIQHNSKLRYNFLLYIGTDQYSKNPVGQGLGLDSDFGNENPSPSGGGETVVDFEISEHFLEAGVQYIHRDIYRQDMDLYFVGETIAFLCWVRSSRF